MFCWQAVSRPIAVELPADLTTMTHLDETGVPARWQLVPDRQAICRSDQHTVMGIFADGYAMHQYDEWLLTTVADILDDDLSISSAGLLRGGAVAWVEVSVPESITTPEGVVFRPNLLATTTFDGRIATTFKRTVTDVVCDNTRESRARRAGADVQGQALRHSHARLANARDALAMVHTIADDFAAEVAQLCATTVTEKQWQSFLDAFLSPVRQRPAVPAKGRGAELADRKRDDLQRLYRHDQRVAPWARHRPRGPAGRQHLRAPP